MCLGIIVFAHGSRIEAANQAVRTAAADLARTGGFQHVEAAFLELGVPDLQGAVRSLVEKGVREVVIVPYFLTPGLHMERDLTRLEDELRLKFNDLRIRSTASLDGHPGLVEAMLDRVRSASD
jgi:sirohydrochlorin ferrochelatase